MHARNTTPVLLFAALFFVAASASLCPTGTLTYGASYSPLTLSGDYSDCSSITFNGVSVTLQGTFKNYINAINSNITTNSTGSTFTNVAWVFNGGKHYLAGSAYTTNSYSISNYASVTFQSTQSGVSSWVCTDAYTVNLPLGATTITNLSLLVSDTGVASQGKANFNAGSIRVTNLVWQGGHITTTSTFSAINPAIDFVPGVPVSSSCGSWQINFGTKFPHYTPVVPDSGSPPLEIVVEENTAYPSTSIDPTYCNGLQMNYTSDTTITGDVINCEINAIGCSVTFAANVIGSQLNGIFNGAYPYLNTAATAVISDSNLNLGAGGAIESGTFHNCHFTLSDDSQMLAYTGNFDGSNFTLTGSAYVQLGATTTNINRIDMLNVNSANYDANAEGWFTWFNNLNVNIFRYQSGNLLGGGAYFATNIGQFQYKPVGNVPMTATLQSSAAGTINYVPWVDNM